MRSPVFCVLPYYSYETNGQTLQNIHCCRWKPGTDVASVRASIARGIRHSACSTCWAAEDQGLDSERQIHNRTMDWIMDRDIERICEDALSGDHDIRMVKLYTSNICNGTCITCGPDSSTAWQELQGIPIRYEQQKSVDINWSQVKYLSLIGGEPLLEKRNWRVLRSVLESGNQDLFVTMVTNGNADINQENRALLKEFNNLNFCLSVDGTGMTFDYLRFPLRWDTLLRNLDLLRDITSNISFSTMVSNINVYFLQNIDIWAKQQNIPVTYKAVTVPSIFHPGNLPENMKKIVKDQCGDLATSFLNGQNDNWDAFQKELCRQDQLKKISARDYLGAWGKMLTDI